MTRKDSFLDEDGEPRPGATYEDNYAAGATDGGYTDRRDDRDRPFDPHRDRDYMRWREAFERWRSERERGV